MSTLFEALADVGAEVARAREKFPTNAHLLGTLAEEVGELAKELLEGADARAVRAEAMQVACVAVRIMTEGDADYAAAPATDAPKKARAKPLKSNKPRKQAAAPEAGKADGKADEDKAAGRAAQACADCGAAYTRTSPRQKYCPDCGAKRLAEQKAAWSARKREKLGLPPAAPRGTNPAATPERLAAIKAADKRLDTIPE